MGRGTAAGLGLLAGGLLGAAARPAVVYAFWLRGAGGDMPLTLLPGSAAIGLVVGVVAVLIAALAGEGRGPLVGAISGAVLAYLFAALTFLPLFWGSLLGIVPGARVVDDEAPLYGLAVA